MSNFFARTQYNLTHNLWYIHGEKRKQDIFWRDLRKTTFGTTSGAAPPECWLLSENIIVIGKKLLLIVKKIQYYHCTTVKKVASNIGVVIMVSENFNEENWFTWTRDTSLQSEALPPFQNRATEHHFSSVCVNSIKTFSSKSGQH